MRWRPSRIRRVDGRPRSDDCVDLVQDLVGKRHLHCSQGGGHLLHGPGADDGRGHGGVCQRERQGHVRERQLGFVRHLDEGLHGLELGRHLGARGREPVRHTAGPPALGQGLVLAVATGQPPAVQRAPYDDTHPVALTGRQYLGFHLTSQDRIRRLFALESLAAATLGHPVSLDDEVGREGRAADGAHLPLVHEVRQGTQGVVDVAGGVGPVYLVKVDPVRAEPLEARLDLAA